MKITVEVPNCDVAEVIVTPRKGICNFIGKIINIDRDTTERERLMNLIPPSSAGQDHYLTQRLFTELIKKVTPE